MGLVSWVLVFGFDVVGVVFGLGQGCWCFMIWVYFDWLVIWLGCGLVCG